MKQTRRFFCVLTCLTAGSLAFGLGPVSCKSETAGEEISFSAAVSGGTSSGHAVTEVFTTYAGWTVKLSKAVVAIGPVYYYGGEPQARLWDGLFGIRSAHACPTHAQYDKGPVLGEIVQQYAVDLLGPAVMMGAVAGLEGDCRSVELHLHPPGKVAAGSPASSFSELAGDTLLLEGTASRETVERPFRVRLTLPDEGLMRIVESIAANVPLRDASEKPGHILIEALADQWLATVDFETLTQQDGETWLVTEETQAWTALVRGVRSKQSYRVTWRSE